MISVLKRFVNYFIPDSSLQGNSRKRRWEEDDGTNTPGLPNYTYKMPRRSDPARAGLATSTPLTRDLKQNLQSQAKQQQPLRTIFVRKIHHPKKENMSDDDVVVLGGSSSRGNYGGVGASAVPPPRMPLASKQDDVEVVFEGMSPVRASSSTATTSFGRTNVTISSWVKPKPRPEQHYHAIESSRSRIMKQKKTTSFAGVKSSHVQDLKKKCDSTLYNCYQLDEKRKYKDMLMNFLSDRNVTRFFSGKKGKSPRFQKEYIELVDLTLTDDNADIGKTIAELKVSRTEERTPQTKALHEEKESDSDIKVLEPSIEVPHKNTLAESLAKKKVLDDSWIPNLVKSYEEKAKSLDEEKKKERERLELLKAKSKEQFQDKHVDRLRKQIEIFDLAKEEEEIEEVEEEFPQLTAEAEDAVDRAFIPTPPNEVLVSASSQNITRRDIATLKGLQWLNDEIINFYMDLIVTRGKLDNYPSAYAFNTFFFPKLMSGGHSALARWTRRVDIFKHDFLFIPVHLGMHWCMIIIDLPEKTITYYDSMGGHDRGSLQKVLQYLVDESRDKKKQVFDTSDWQLITAKDIPHQMNGSDCGMFSCMFAETVSRRKKINFTQEHMPYFRRRMVYEILTKQLLS